MSENKCNASDDGCLLIIILFILMLNTCGTDGKIDRVERKVDRVIEAQSEMTSHTLNMQMMLIGGTP